ncbi:kelch-like protein 17 [Gigaspora margarita]|uniref:Kelch-like protein 17 n=1 Tax=Gigaspora margarita TaxID=4874 RepID=A0A8H4EP72_GIGMA|nr:kelch-like protein 17 [Gigaspora margarita]
MTNKFYEKLSSNLNYLLTNGNEYNIIIEVGKVNVSVLFDLLIASNLFGLQELVDYVQQILIENNSLWKQNNLYRIYQTIFCIDNIETLQPFCANIITQHSNIIFDHDEFISLPENIDFYFKT